MKQEEKQREELIADWDEMYVGVSMMLSVSISRNSLVECFSFSLYLNISQFVRSSFVDCSDPPSEFILDESTEKTVELRRPGLVMLSILPLQGVYTFEHSYHAHKDSK